MTRPCRVAGWVSWGILPLGWASPEGTELIPGSGVRAQRPRGPSGHRGTAGCGAGPQEQAASCPRLRASPPYHRQALPHLPTASPPRIPAPHAGSMHGIPAAPCSAAGASAPWLLWLLFLAPLGNPLPGFSRGAGVGRIGVRGGVSPGFCLGSQLLIHGQPLGGESESCLLPALGWGTQDSPGSPVPDWRGPAHPGSGWHHRWGGGEAAEWLWTPAVLGGREGPCWSARGWREPGPVPSSQGAPSHRATVSQGIQAPRALPLAQPLTASLLQPGPTDRRARGGFGVPLFFFSFFF